MNPTRQTKKKPPKRNAQPSWHYKLKQFSLLVVKKFFQDDCLYRASALTFTTLLAIIPLMYVILSLLSFSSLTESFVKPMESFILKNFIPATGYVLDTYLKAFAEQAKVLPRMDLVFLLVTVFFMMLTIEYALNAIWRAPNARENWKAFILYFAIIAFAPLLFGLSLMISSFIFSLPLFHEVPIILPFFVHSLPFFFSLLGFTFLYVVVPNCPVKFSEGLVGGLFAAISFELAKKGFVFYLSQFHGYDRLYGAFAVIPIFFMWVYFVWLITLLGAEISYAYGKVRHEYPV